MEEGASSNANGASGPRAPGAQSPGAQAQKSPVANQASSPRASPHQSPRASARGSPHASQPGSPTMNAHGDVGMQNVPLSPVHSQNGRPLSAPPSPLSSMGSPRQHVIVMSPPTPLDDYDRSLDGGSGRKGRKPENEDMFFSAPGMAEGQPDILALTVEMLVVVVAVLLPVFLLNMTGEWDKYSLFEFPVPAARMNARREFERLAYFTAVSYAAYILCVGVCSLVPPVLESMARASRHIEGQLRKPAKALPTDEAEDDGQSAMYGLRGAMPAVAVALGMLAIWAIGSRMMYESSRATLTRFVASGLSGASRAEFLAQELGARAEGVLSALFFLGLFVAFQKFVFAKLQHSYKRAGVHPRVERVNAQYAAVEALYDATNAADRDMQALAVRAPPTPFVDDGETLRPDDIDVSGEGRAKAVATAIFSSLNLPVSSAPGSPAGSQSPAVAPGSPSGVQSPAAAPGSPAAAPGSPAPTDANKTQGAVMTLETIKPFFPAKEAEAAWSLLDPEHKQRLSLDDLAACIAGVVMERRKAARVLRANAHVLGKLDTALFSVFLGLGLAIACVSMGGTRGMEIAVSVGTMLFGLSLMLSPVFTRVMDTYMFVFAEHAYDECDRICVEGAPSDERDMAVRKISVYTTVLVRTDGSVVYAPNHALRPRTIYNRDRDRTAADTVVASAPASSLVVGTIGALQAAVSARLQQDVRDFTGRVDIAIVAVDGDKATLRVEPHFRRPACAFLGRGAALRARRASVRAAFEEGCKAASVDATVEYADE